MVVKLELSSQQLDILRGLVAVYILQHSTDDPKDKALIEAMREVWAQIK